MSKTIRIRTTPNGSDKYLNVNLDQDFDFIEILSLSLSQEDVYRKFCSDYGVIVGRVTVNSGFGVPNAKVSVFIPLDDVDKNNSEIKGIYPYEVITDKNNDGIRYNVLPKESETNNECFTPVGTLPTKREVLDEPTVLDIYCKYYKFTTTTNHAGDFMIFGVPVGTYTVHIDADISDIGPVSQRPYDLVRQGTPAKLFDSATKFKGGTNLDKLPQIKTANIGVNVQPFWGDTENCRIGITRVDFDLNYTVVPSAIFMGSVYGDQSKNSINKRCRPRKKFGKICEQVSGQGSIEMIRTTVDGSIEEFSVDGGRLIDDDGTWAFQLPMNLDYMITDETGNMVPSNDPNIGVPTRANVRFKINMDETGGEGRLRTRASYLVPNNPETKNDIDYEFSDKTKAVSFKELYWNKIYTVSNFIPRYQRRFNGVHTRNMVAMKDVDACVGDKNPFPYNRVNTQSNPIFFIICLIIKIIGFFVFIFNKIILPVINVIVGIVRGIVNFINGLGAHLNVPSFVPCMTIACPSDDPAYYAPGCNGEHGNETKGFIAANESGTPPTFYGNDDFGHKMGPKVDLCGLDDCMAFQMAQSLDMFQFDFYNDWSTGSLYSYLLKYKKRKKGTEKFCEYDCQDFNSDQNYTGVDGNKNGRPDNQCLNQELIDSCFNCGDQNCQNESRESGVVREGLIKKYNGELYYASTRHNADNFKLFATDIVCLGSVFECDWQGFPKLQPLLVETTYKLPPESPEIETLPNGTSVVTESGMVSLAGSLKGVFFTVNCIGLHVDSTQCLNVRHICEAFVEGDEAILDQQTNTIAFEADGIIGGADIDDTTGRQFRNSYIVLNSGTTSANSFILNDAMVSEFNPDNCSLYNFTNTSPCGIGGISNTTEYANFRGFTPQNDNTYTQPKHSFYMYFGLKPGKTALDKMNDRYFTTCIPVVRDSSLIAATTTPSTGSTCDGTISFTFAGGQPPFTYTITSENGTYISGNTINVTQPIEVNGLCEGTYTISGFDILGNPVTQIVSVAGKQLLDCLVGVSQNVTTAGISDGVITIYDVMGGTPPYNYVLKDGLGGIVSSNAISTPMYLTSLPIDNIGYSVAITDSANPSSVCLTTGLTITGPTQLNLIINTVRASCANLADGSITVVINGGQSPYQISVTGVTDTSFVSNSLNVDMLFSGVYDITVTDSLNTTQTAQVNVGVSSLPLVITSAAQTDLTQQCNPNLYVIPFKIAAGAGGNYGFKYVEYRIDSQAGWTTVQTNEQYTVSNTNMTFNVNSAIASSIIFRLVSDNGPCRSNNILYDMTNINKPVAVLTGVYGNYVGSSGGPYTYTINQVAGGTSPYTIEYGANTTNTSTGPTIQFTSLTVLPVGSIVLKDSVGCSKTIY